MDQGRPLQRLVYQPDGVGGASQRLLLQDAGQRPDPRRTGPGALRQPVEENHGEHRTHRGRTYSWDTTFEGVIPNLERRYKTTESDYMRSQIERYMSARTCQPCGGKRLRPEALAVRVCGLGIMDVCSKNIGKAMEWVREIDPDLVSDRVSDRVSDNDGGEPKKQVLTEREKTIANQVLKEIDGRLKFLDGIGLDYITMDRTARTPLGRRGQRVRLATQIGSGLTGVLYVCDEPTVGLHPHDDQRLINTLTQLRDMGNTVVVVEHDEAMMRSADFIADLGPGAGEHGGHVVATGTVADIEASPDSITGQYLSGRKRVPVPETRRAGNGNSLRVVGARENNLRNVTVDFPLDNWCASRRIGLGQEQPGVRGALQKAEPSD